MRLFFVALFLFASIISKSQTYLELLGNLEVGNYFIGMTNPSDYIGGLNDYNCHNYYDNEIKPEQIDSLENDIANKLRIYTFMPNELLIDNDSIWQNRKELFVKRMLSFGVYNQYKKNDLFKNAQYFGVNQDSNAIQYIYSLYPMYFEDQLSPPFIFEFWDDNQAFKSFYDNLLSANSLPDDCDTRFYNEILGKNKSTYNEWTALARTLQYEDFIFKNSNNYERLLGVLVTIHEYLKNSQTTFVGKEGLYTGLGLAYLDLGNTDQEYKSYIYSLKTASYINIGNGQFVYNYFPLLRLVKSLSAYNGDFHFVNKITDLLNSKNIQFQDSHTPFIIKTSNKTYSNYEYLIVKGCFELEKLYLNPDYIEQFKLIELGIVSQLINFYNDSKKNNIVLDKFVVSLYFKAIAKYVERNYMNEQVSLYYLQYAFDLSLNSYSSSFYEQCTDEYLISLISNGYYARAKELIDLCMVSQVTNNQFIYYCSRINLIRYYMGIEDIDSAIDVFNSFQEEIDNSYYPNDHYLKKAYYMSEIEIAERLDSTRLIAEGELGLKNAERDFTVVYNNYQKLEDEVTTELQQKNIELINEELYRKQREIELKEVELKNKNDSLGIITIGLNTATSELSATKKVRDSIQRNNNILMKKAESLNLAIHNAEDTLMAREANITTLNKSVKKYNTIAWVLAGMTTLISICLAIALYFLHRSQQFATGFIQKRLLYHQAKNDNLTFESSLSLANEYIDNISPRDNISSNRLLLLKSKLDNLRLYLKDLFIYQESTIVNSKRQFVSLAEEITNVQAYLKLVEHKRNISIDLIQTDAIVKNCHSIQIPPNILQPFVENSVKHGFVNENGNTISIDLQKRNNVFNLLLTDNGQGIDNGILISKYKERGFFDLLFSKSQINDKSISLSDIEEYLFILRRQLKSKIQFNIHKNIRRNTNGGGTIVELENIKL